MSKTPVIKLRKQQTTLILLVVSLLSIVHPFQPFLINDIDSIAYCKCCFQKISKQTTKHSTICLHCIHYYSLRLGLCQPKTILSSSEEANTQSLPRVKHDLTEASPFLRQKVIGIRVSLKLQGFNAFRHTQSSGRRVQIFSHRVRCLPK